VDEPPLPELVDPPPPPPDHLIKVHGAQLVRVVNIDDPDARRRRGFREAMFLAWAPVHGGEDWIWAALTAWLGHRQTGARTTGGGRHAWLLLATDDLERCRIRAVRPYVMDDDEWHGHDPASEFSIAVRDAAATLPERLREAAVTPRPPEPAEPEASPVPRPAPSRSDVE